MSEKYIGRGSVFYPRNSLRPTCIISFRNLSFPFSFSSSFFQLGLSVKVYVEWPKQSQVNPAICFSLDYFLVSAEIKDLK